MKLTVATSCLLLLPWWSSAISVDGDLFQRSLALGRRENSVDDKNDDSFASNVVDSASRNDALPTSTVPASASNEATPTATANVGIGDSFTATRELTPTATASVGIGDSFTTTREPTPASSVKSQETPTASPVPEPNQSNNDDDDGGDNNKNNNEASSIDKQPTTTTDEAPSATSTSSSPTSTTTTETSTPTPVIKDEKVSKPEAAKTKKDKSASSIPQTDKKPTSRNFIVNDGSAANKTSPPPSSPSATNSTAAAGDKVKAMSVNETQETGESAPAIKAESDPVKLIVSGLVVFNGLVLAFVGFRYPRLTMFYSGIITFGSIALVIMNAIHPYDMGNSKLTFIYLLVTLFSGLIGSCIFLAIGHRMTPAVGLMGGLMLAVVVRAVLPASQVKNYVHLALILGLPVLGLTATLCMKRVTVIFSTALAGATVASFGADLIIGTYFLFYGVYRKNSAGEYVAIPMAWAQWAVLVFIAFVCMVFQLMKYRGEFYRDPKKRFRMSTHPITL